MVHALLAPQMVLPRDELDRQLSPSLSAKDAGGCLATYNAATERAKASRHHRVLADVAYGGRADEQLDLYLPQIINEKPVPCALFLHGGFWQEGSKDGAGFPAENFTQHGWAFAAVGYGLTPKVRLSNIVEQIDRCVHFLHRDAPRWGIDPASIVIAGHSAGAHLAACMIADVLENDTADCLAGAVLISGVYDLGPIARSYVNDAAGITKDEIERFSPLRRSRPETMRILAVIGSDEPQAFQSHTDALSAVWSTCQADFSTLRVDGKDHFDILTCLSAANGDVFRHILSMIDK